MLNFTSSLLRDVGSCPDELERAALVYHDIFDYPLNTQDLVRWRPARVFAAKNTKATISHQNGFYFLAGRKGLVFKRVLRRRISVKKIDIANKAAAVLARIPSIRMIAVTGSCAMENATDESDIDLLIITSANLLWSTRLLSYILLKIYGIGIRKPRDRDQSDKLCLNMWFDESNLVWKYPRNAYTAHEIAQVVPLINKNGAYEEFIRRNRWIKNFWPNAARIENHEPRIKNYVARRAAPVLVEKISYLLQSKYMKSKITREVVTPTRAIFHPFDWGSVVLKRVAS